MAVFYNHASEIATVSVVFRVSGTATDPTTISLVVTDPDGVSTTYTYAGATITRTGTGAYTKDISCTSTRSGVWSYRWVGTGAAADVEMGSWSTVSTSFAERYTTLETLKSSLGITDTDRDGLLTGCLLAAAREVDALCNRRFYLDTSASSRTYRVVGNLRRDPDGERLLVEDFGTTTGLVVESGAAGSSSWTTLTSGTGYEVDPDNASARGEPYTGIRLLGAVYLHSQSRIRVTARWGWPQVPDVVAQATLIQAARLYKRKDSPEGVLGTSEWGSIRVSRVDPDVAGLVRHLILPSF